jgi:uracil-DNA glycosylase family 4
MINRKNFVPPEGSESSKIMIVGEQPGFQEVSRRKPFVGPAGQVLNECLQMAGIARFDCYITNVIKSLDKHIKSYIDLSGNSPVMSQETLEFLDILKDEILRVRPNIVVGIGAIPLYALTSRTSITPWRGSVLESTLVPGVKTISTFHTATVLPDKGQYLNKPLIVNDLKKALNESKFPEFRIKSRQLYIKPTFEESISALNTCIHYGLEGKIIDWDIEVINEELNCISFAWNEYEAISIPFYYSKGDYFNIEQEVSIMLKIAELLQNPNIAKGGANNIFDCQFMLHKYGIVPAGSIHCTQIAQKIAFPDYKAGLDFVTSMHTDIPYYKADGKKWIKAGGGGIDSTWWRYSALDSISTSAARPSQLRELESQGNIETYDRQRALIYPLMYMMERGINVDVSGIIKENEATNKLIEDTQKELNELAGYELNINSPKQVKDYFYDVKGLKPYKKRTPKGWSISTDENALKRIARQGYKEASLILKLRGLKKRISTYLNVVKFDTDGRFKTSYKPVGTDTGRLSSGETIFGLGGNAQNWPHDLLRFFTADRGYIVISQDMSQIENRLVAYLGDVTTMINAFEGGIDVHSLTASMIFGKSISEVTTEDGTCTLGDGTHSERFWGKKANHGLNYDLGYRSFALLYEMQERDAKSIIDLYHKAYPGVREGFHNYVKIELRKNRSLVNLFGRRRVFLGPLFGPGSDETYKTAYAHIPQSTTADLINSRGLNYIYYSRDKFKEVELLSQIHDSVVYQIPISVGWKRVAEIITDIKDSLEKPLTFNGRSFSIPCDTSIGINMSKEFMKDIKSSKYPKTLSDTANLIESIYKTLI